MDVGQDPGFAIFDQFGQAALDLIDQGRVREPIAGAANNASGENQQHDGKRRYFGDERRRSALRAAIGFKTRCDSQVVHVLSVRFFDVPIGERKGFYVILLGLHLERRRLKQR